MKASVRQDSSPTEIKTGRSEKKMINYEIYFNKTYKNSCNLVRKDIKGHYLHIDQVNKVVIIDNVIIAKLEEVNEIRFLVKGYYQNVHIAEPDVKISSTDII